MPRRPSTGVLTALAVALLATGCVGSRSAVSTDSGSARFISGDGVATFVPAGDRDPAPELSGTDLDGAPLDVRPGGDVLVLNVWGSWCAPCIAEQPALERLWRATRSRGVRFVGINIRDGGRTSPRRHVRRYGVTYPSLYDPSSRLLTRFRSIPPKTIPTTYVVDRVGRIAAYVYGAGEEQGLAALVDRVLAEPAA